MRILKFLFDFIRQVPSHVDKAKLFTNFPQDRKFHYFFDIAEHEKLKILFLVSGYNGMSQRLHRELVNLGHEVSVELAIDDAKMIKSVEDYKPNLILAPMLKKAIPTEIWTKNKCLILHPGIRGDRGPSSIDWAILNKEDRWGVTVLQANEEMDAGDIWATSEFPLDATEAGISAMLEAVKKFQTPGYTPVPLDYSNPEVRGTLRPTMKQSDRKFDWANDSTLTILTKIFMSDNQPGVLAELCGEKFFLYDAHLESSQFDGRPGEIIGQRDGAVLVKTVDGAVWIGHMKTNLKNQPNIKLKATTVLGDRISNVPIISPSVTLGRHTYNEISYHKANQIGILKFNFYNGAMSSQQCQRLVTALEYAKIQDTKILLLQGSQNFFSNGIHLNVIETNANPADEAYTNINAINDVVKSIINTKNQLTIAAVEGNAGAGGVALALACDRVIARSGSVLNMHYKNMGLFGSEYHTYSLPKRVGKNVGSKILNDALPMLGMEAYKINMVDHILSNNRVEFLPNCLNIASEYTDEKIFPSILEQKFESRYKDERQKPLEAYRDEELQEMRKNMYQNNWGFNEKRRQFVLKTNPDKTPENIAIHSRKSKNSLDNIIDGKSLADEMLDEVKEKVAESKSQIGIVPHLAIIRIGDNPGSISYIKQKTKACERAGIHSTEYVFAEHHEAEAIEFIHELNSNPEINGILIQLPIPAKIYSVAEIQELINPEKDVDGFNARNFGGMALGLKNSLTPCTPRGIIKILEKYDKELLGKHTVVVGKSNIVGKPLTNLILEKTHATVTVCHKETENLKHYTQQADVLIVAAGVPNLIKEDMVKQDSIIIDVGISRVDDSTKKSGYKLVGDVDFENVRKKVKLITPVPGGVGPLTVASLISNTLEAFTNQNELLIEETQKKRLAQNSS